MQPNIILINCDDLGYGDLGCYGSTVNQTPALDRMAAEGMRLWSAYAEPSCTPTRIAINTGRHPVRTGLLSVLWPGQPEGLSPKEETIAEVFEEPEAAADEDDTAFDTEVDQEPSVSTEAFEEAVEDEPEDVERHETYAKVLFRLERLDEAETAGFDWDVVRAAMVVNSLPESARPAAAEDIRTRGGRALEGILEHAPGGSDGSISRRPYVERAVEALL